jgi:hypothetical protein
MTASAASASAVEGTAWPPASPRTPPTRRRPSSPPHPTHYSVRSFSPNIKLNLYLLSGQQVVIKTPQDVKMMRVCVIWEIRRLLGYKFKFNVNLLDAEDNDLLRDCDYLWKDEMDILVTLCEVDENELV